ncbi:F-box protein CPR1-like [Papaver somniferum]|uniref:F-box protein CPR1-like n=1 Tax=Papaver somniferum TaxID=3469 RepID=UPI000E7039CF|nr:F-box protein CPR1-like [Papaver somniferum]
MHLTHTTQKNHYRLMLRNHSSRSYLLHSISYDSLSSFLESSKAKRIAYDLVAMDYPFKSQGFGIELGGSVNGLVCLWCNEDDREFLCLWNPATTEYKEIPKSPNDLSNDNTELYALGYDYLTDDYKLIKVVCFEDKQENSPVDVYSLTTNSWRSVQSIPYRFPFPREPGVLVNRDLHWLGVKSAKQGYSLFGCHQREL